jgi:hypothetical protein
MRILWLLWPLCLFAGYLCRGHDLTQYGDLGLYEKKKFGSFMKNQKGIQLRIVNTIVYSFGFILGMTAKNWWILPISIVTTFVISFCFFFFKKLFQIWGIGSKNVEAELTRQQRRANVRQLARQND